ncbi:MAG TPA: cytochrome P450 [Actinomycetota bacterium]|nr:cytochrome P450 [Actinomycetota bacterium]
MRTVAAARPPGPELSPFAGLRAFRRDPIGLLERAARYGDVAYLRLPRTDTYLINDPELVWELFVTRARHVGKGPTIRASRLMLGEGLLTSEEPAHRRQRLLLNPLFHHDRLSVYGETMVDHALAVAERWRDGENIDVHREMARLTLGVVASTIFAIELGSNDTATVTGALTEILAMFDRIYSPLFPVTIRLPIPSTVRFRRRRAEIDRIVLRLIAERRASGAGGDDLLSLLIRAQEGGEGLSDRQVRDQALTLFLAGHETTANALAWTWWFLAGHPEAEEDLHEELDRVLAERRPGVADLAALPYTDAVILEAIRLRPPAWAIGRTALERFELGGFDVAAGSVLVVSPYLLDRDERWFSDALAFRPERWLEERPPRGAFIPFGAGPRQCIGEGFARMEARLVLATLARGWRFRRPPGPEPALHPSITLRPRHGIPMALDRRGGGSQILG